MGSRNLWPTVWASSAAIKRRPARTCQSRRDVVAHVVSRAAHLGGVVEREGAVHVGRPRVGAALHQNVQRLHLAAHCNRKSHGEPVTQSSVGRFMSNFTGEAEKWVIVLAQQHAVCKGEDRNPFAFSREAWLDGRQISPRDWETREHCDGVI